LPAAKISEAPRAAFPGSAEWFRLDIGRKKNADPKWLLPMLCRKGNIKKRDIGVIRIFEHETKFEVAEPVAAQFAVNMLRPGGDNINVERMSERSERVNVEVPAKGFKPKRNVKAERKR
jgi:ATP-dependent RNA helicase DeaD